MAVSDFEKLQAKVGKVKSEKEIFMNICKNLKKFRLEKYKEFKNKQGSTNSINPYTTEKMAELLDYSHTHYKRFESETDSTKKIPLTKLKKIAIILGKKVDDFIDDDEN